MTQNIPKKAPFGIHPDDASQLLACLVYQARKKMAHIDQVAALLKETDLQQDEKDAYNAKLALALEVTMPLHHHYFGFHRSANGAELKDDVRDVFFAIKGRPIVVTEEKDTYFPDKGELGYKRNIRITKDYLALVGMAQDKSDITSPRVKKFPFQGNAAPAQEKAPEKTFSLRELFLQANEELKAEAEIERQQATLQKAEAQRKVEEDRKAGIKIANANFKGQTILRL